jgi:ABC-2 type transport system ATP-binding protein
MTYIEAHGLRKVYGANVALDGIDLRIDEGRIVGLIGPNGAGKTTALNAIVGLTSYDGSLRVLGRDPWSERDAVMQDVCFITDVAVMPRWIRVSQAIEFIAGIHPKFDRTKAEAFLSKTTIRPRARVKELSKGMVTQLHLALVMAIDARVLVLDEPTLGLDLLYRKQFYDTLLADFLEKPRAVIVATHQVEEVQHVLTDVLFIDRGRIVFNRNMDDVEARYQEVRVHPDKLTAARALRPIAERQGIGHSVLLFEGVERPQLAAFGDTRTPSIADLFVAIVSGTQGARS